MNTGTVKWFKASWQTVVPASPLPKTFVLLS